MRPEEYFDAPRSIRAVEALRKPDAAFARVPGTVRDACAEVIVDLMEAVSRLAQRQHDTDWLNEAAFQILKENGLMPSSSELIAARDRARAERGATPTPPSEGA